MTSFTENRGLCGNCLFAARCYYLASRGPAHFCELYLPAEAAERAGAGRLSGGGIGADPGLAGEQTDPSRCATCVRAPTCVFLESVGPTRSCQFHQSSFENRSLRTAAATATGGVSAESERVAAGDLRGLCINCAHRQSCNHRRAPGGVWHCEDYE